MEHDVILKVLQANQWNRRKTAEILKISYRALLYKVRQAGLPARRPRRKETGKRPCRELSANTSCDARF